MKAEVFTLKTCDSCRKATKWLKEHDITFEETPIRESPPTSGVLQQALAHYGGEIRRIFNTSGQVYRTLNLKEKLPMMSDSEALELLASNGNLIKRPFLVMGPKTLVGFEPEEWSDSLL